MINLSFNELMNYRIETKTDLQQALKEISNYAFITQRVQQELKIAVRQRKDYINVIKQKDGLHGLSLVKDDRGQLILTYYQFHKGA